MELFTQSNSLMSMLITALVALLCGTVVGLEREIHDKPAGLKTNALICLGAAMYVYLGGLLVQEGGGDPLRLPSQVIAGAGFLGAEAIIHEGKSILGLTTAATLWTITAIGLFIGTGHFALAILLTGITVAILIFLRLIERLLAGSCNQREGKILFHDIGKKTRAHLIEVLQAYNAPHDWRAFAPAAEEMSLIFQYCDRHNTHRGILLELWQVEGVISIQSSL